MWSFSDVLDSDPFCGFSCVSVLCLLSACEWMWACGGGASVHDTMSSVFEPCEDGSRTAWQTSRLARDSCSSAAQIWVGRGSEDEEGARKSERNKRNKHSFSRWMRAKEGKTRWKDMKRTFYKVNTGNCQRPFLINYYVAKKIKQFLRGFQQNNAVWSAEMQHTFIYQYKDFN